MNLSTLISRAMVRFQDPDGHTFGEGEWRAYVNDAYADVLAARFDWPFMETRRTSVAAAAGASAVALPDDVWHVGAVFNATDGFALTPLHGRAEARRDFPSSDAAGAPTFYRIIGAQLELYPTPERATTLEIDAFAPPAELAAGTDEPAFPRQHHRILVDGALAYAHDDDGKPQAGQLHRGRFEQGIRRLEMDLYAPRHEGYVPLLDTGV